MSEILILAKREVWCYKQTRIREYR